MGRTKKSHSDYCHDICIACLVRPKASFRKPLISKNGDNYLETLVSSHLYEKYFEDKDFLPKSICVNCKSKLTDSIKCSKFPIVDYVGLVENIKSEVSKASHTEKCCCEICILACANQNNSNYSESRFLKTENRSKAGISESKQPKISEFFNVRSHATILFAKSN